MMIYWLNALATKTWFIRAGNLTVVVKFASFCCMQMTYAIFGGTLNPAHSLTICHMLVCLIWSEIYSSLSTAIYPSSSTLVIHFLCLPLVLVPQLVYIHTARPKYNSSPFCIIFSSMFSLIASLQLCFNFTFYLFSWVKHLAWICSVDIWSQCCPWY